MNYVRKIGALIVAACVMGSTAQAASHEKPDAELRVSGGSFAAGIGFNWGSGTLIYKGKEYPVKVRGMSIGKVGISGSSAVGQVYGLRELRDFDGHYNAGGAGVTVVGGVSTVALKNEHGVGITLRSNNRGVDLTLAHGGIDMRIKK